MKCVEFYAICVPLLLCAIPPFGMNILSRWLRNHRRTPALPDDTARSEPAKAIPDGATLLITHAELSSRHGTGALLLKILGNEPSLAVFYSKDFFKAHDIEVPAFLIQSSGNQLSSGRRLVQAQVSGKKIQRIICVPFYEDEVQTALAAQEWTGAPLALYIMDDQNVHVHGIPDKPLAQLIDRANICVAISPALCAAYTEKFQRRFWLAPPTADPNLFVPPGYEFKVKSPPRGILVGNLWSSHTLGQFRETVRQSGFRIDWCGNAGKPFIQLDLDELRKEGIFLHSHLPERELIELARAADFAVIPAGTLDDSDTHNWLALASLPSRIVYLMATANVPMVVMGHPETAAAQFVTTLRLGAVCSYHPASFQEAICQVTDPATAVKLRERARTLSPTFSSRELAAWLWQSMDQRHAVDNRFESLLLSSR
jgi:hypothetical protein